MDVLQSHGRSCCFYGARNVRLDTDANKSLNINVSDRIEGGCMSHIVVR